MAQRLTIVVEVNENDEEIETEILRIVTRIVVDAVSLLDYGANNFVTTQRETI